MLQQGNTVVGKITKLFGSNGELQVKLYDIFPEDFQLTEPLFVEIDELMVPLFCEFFERRGQSSSVIKFTDIDNDYRAQELIGREIMLPFEDDESEDDGNIYFEDLVGFDVTIDEVYSGKIDDFIEGENPLLRILVEDKEVLIPAVADFVDDIDTKGRKVVMSVPRGLLELYLS